MDSFAARVRPMSKTLLYRLLGLGKIPRDAIDQIQKEGIVLQDEGIGGSVTFKRFRAPGKYYVWKRNWFSGSVVLTREHFLVFRYSQPIIGVSWGDTKIRKLDVRLENENTLFVGFEASTFQEAASGEIEVRLSTPLARELLKQIEHCVAQIHL